MRTDRRNRKWELNKVDYQTGVTEIQSQTIYTVKRMRPDEVYKRE
jgi:hypothetical protein